MAPIKSIAAGARLTFIGFVDNLNFLLGGSTTAPANGSGSGMLAVVGIQQVPFGLPEGEAVPVPGDDTTLGQFLFPSDALPEFIINMGANDLTQDSLLQGTLVESFGQGYIGVLQPNSPAYADVCLIVQGLAKSKDAGSDGVSGYDIFMFPLCNIQPLDRETAEGRTAAVNRWKVTPSIFSRKPWGVTVLDAVNGTDGAVGLHLKFDNPVTMHRFTGSGAVTTVTLDKTPVNVNKIVVVRDTQVLVPTTDYTINTSTRVLTFLAAPAAGAKTVIFYEFTP